MSNPSTRNAHQVTTERLLANLPAGYTFGTNVKLANRPLGKPNDSKWLELNIVNQDVTSDAGKWKRYFAQIVIDIYYPKNHESGNLDALSDAELIQPVFENKDYGGLTNNDVKCFNVLIQDLGAEKSWYNIQLNADITYEGQSA